MSQKMATGAFHNVCKRNVSLNIHFKFKSEGVLHGFSITWTLFGLLALFQ